MCKYLEANKRIPMSANRDKSKSVPRRYIPTEKKCPFCDVHLSKPIRITAKATVSYNGFSSATKSTTKAYIIGCMLHVRALCYIYWLYVIYTGSMLHIRVAYYIYELYVTYTGCILYIRALCYIYGLYVTYTGCMLHIRALCYIYGLYVTYTGLCYIYGLYVTYTEAAYV